VVRTLPASSRRPNANRTLTTGAAAGAVVEVDAAVVDGVDVDGAVVTGAVVSGAVTGAVVTGAVTGVVATVDDGSTLVAVPPSQDGSRATERIPFTPATACTATSDAASGEPHRSVAFCPDIVTSSSTPTAPRARRASDASECSIRGAVMNAPPTNSATNATAPPTSGPAMPRRVGSSAFVMSPG